MESQWDSLREQWQASPLLRLGSWSIGLILLVYLLLGMDDRLALTQLEWRRAAADIGELQAVQRESYWPGMVERLESERQALLAETWPQETAGLAKAAVREFLNRTVASAESELRIRSTELAEPRLVNPGLYELRGRLTASTEGLPVPWAWIAALESASPKIYLDSIDVRVGRKSGVAVIIEFRALLSALSEGGAS